MNFYHGTRKAFTKGGLLLPSAVAGYPVAEHEGFTLPEGWVDDRGEHVHVTTDLGIAWMFARSAPGRGKPRVLVVLPYGPISKDPATIGGEEAPTYRCFSALVAEVLK